MRLHDTLLRKLRALARVLHRVESNASLRFDRCAGALQINSLLDASEIELLAHGLGLELAGQLPGVDSEG